MPAKKRTAPKKAAPKTEAKKSTPKPKAVRLATVAEQPPVGASEVSTLAQFDAQGRRISA